MERSPPGIGQGTIPSVGVEELASPARGRGGLASGQGISKAGVERWDIWAGEIAIILEEAKLPSLV